MKKKFFTKRKIITFYSEMEKHKIFEKIKICYRTLSFRKNKDFLPNIILKDKYCENFKNTYFEELLRTAASEITYGFYKTLFSTDSFFYKNEKKGNLIEITQTMQEEKNCNKIK